jgi:hypothetical protein
MENVKNGVCCFSIEENVFERDDMTYLHDVILYQYVLMSYLPHITTLRLIWIALTYRRNRRSAQRSRMSVVLLSSTRQFHRKIAEQ